VANRQHSFLQLFAWCSVWANTSGNGAVWNHVHLTLVCPGNWQQLLAFLGARGLRQLGSVRPKVEQHMGIQGHLEPNEPSVLRSFWGLFLGESSWRWGPKVGVWNQTEWVTTWCRIIFPRFPVFPPPPPPAIVGGLPFGWFMIDKGVPQGLVNSTTNG